MPRKETQDFLKEMKGPTRASFGEARVALQGFAPNLGRLDEEFALKRKLMHDSEYVEPSSFVVKYEEYDDRVKTIRRLVGEVQDRLRQLNKALRDTEALEAEIAALAAEAGYLEA